MAASAPVPIISNKIILLQVALIFTNNILSLVTLHKKTRLIVAAWNRSNPERVLPECRGSSAGINRAFHRQRLCKTHCARDTISGYATKLRNRVYETNYSQIIALQHEAPFDWLNERRTVTSVVTCLNLPISEAMNRWRWTVSFTEKFVWFVITYDS